MLTILIYTFCGFGVFLILWLIGLALNNLFNNGWTVMLCAFLTVILHIAGLVTELVVATCVIIWLIKHLF